MTAAALLADLRREGFTLAAEGDGIRVAPFSRLSTEQSQAIRTHKGALLALLQSPAADAPAESPRAAAPPPLRRADVMPQCYPVTWEEEYRIEANLLRARIAGYQDAEARRALVALASETPAGEQEVSGWGRRLLDLECRLRHKGRLPVYPWPPDD